MPISDAERRNVQVDEQRSAEQPRVMIELYGVPRLQAGIDRVAARGATAFDALANLAAICPRLNGTIIKEGWPHPAYRVSLNGDRFLTDRATPLRDGDTLILLAADAGG